jgi:hypothetical protein
VRSKVARGGGWACLDSHGAEADPQRSHLPVVGRIDGRHHQPGEQLLQEALEFVAGDPPFELEALDPCADEPATPVPPLQLAQRITPVDNLIVQKSKYGNSGGPEAFQQLVGAIDRLLA